MAALLTIRSYCSYVRRVSRTSILSQSEPGRQDLETSYDNAYTEGGDLPVLYSYEVPCSYCTVATTIPPYPFSGGAAHGW